MSDIDWRLENQKKQTAVEEAHREIARLRAALREIANPTQYVTSDGYPSKAAARIAKEALE